MEQTREDRSRDPDYDPDIDGYAEDLTGRQGAHYRFGRSERSDSHWRDSVPLFISDRDGIPHPSEYMIPVQETRPPRASMAARILASLLMAAAAAILFVVFSSDFTRDIIVNAKASIPPVVPAPSVAAQPDPTRLTANDIQLKDPTRLAAPFNQTPGARIIPTVAVAPAAARPAPAQVATASQAALQRRPPAAVAPAPAPGPRKIDADELATLMNRAKGLLATGDIPPARLLLERAANAQEASAALLLAQTYDPDVLGVQDSRSITPDPAAARSWYQKAAQFGSSDAQQRLAQMQN
jgi:hypothetical protein